MKQVVEAANLIKEKHDKIDVLINNAGGLTPERMENSQGVEMQFAGNYLGHALLTELLLPELKKAAPSRIVNVSSGAHSTGKIHFDDINLKNNYTAWRAYSQSKLAQVLSTYKLAEELKSFNITVNAIHPGAVKSGLTRGVPNIGKKIAPVIYKLIGISAEKGAKTIIYLATAPEVEGVTGKYFDNCKVKKSSKLSYDKMLQAKLGQITENMLKVFQPQS